MIELRPGSDGDREQVLALIDQVFGRAQAERAARRWHWQWHEDPRLQRPGYRGIVAVWHDRVIATLSCLPAGLYIDGEPVAAHWCVDVLTHWGLTKQALREQRRLQADAADPLPRGIAAALLDHPDAGPIQLGKFVADPMKAIGLRIGFEPLADSGNYSRRLSYRQSMQAALGPGVGRLAAAALDLSLISAARPRLPVEVMQGPFDARFDRFWERLKRDHRAVALRDAALLNWRYRAHPDTRYIVLMIPRLQEVRGFLVLSLYRQSARLRAKVVDLAIARDDRRAAHDLLAAALRLARQEGADRIGCFVTGALVERTVREFGFRERVKKRSGQRQPLLTRGLPVPELYATAGDGDGG